MSKLILTGAKRFIDMPKGTMYFNYWSSKESCANIITIFDSNPIELLSDFGNMEIYGDNSGSMIFYNDESDIDSPISYTDINIVGDANPMETLYLIFEKDLLAATIRIDGEYNSIILTKEEVLKYRDKFLKNFTEMDNTKDKTNDWARDKLYNDKDYKDDCIVNYYKEINI